MHIFQRRINPFVEKAFHKKFEASGGRRFQWQLLTDICGLLLSALLGEALSTCMVLHWLEHVIPWPRTSYKLLQTRCKMHLPPFSNTAQSTQHWLCTLGDRRSLSFYNIQHFVFQRKSEASKLKAKGGGVSCLSSYRRRDGKWPDCQNLHTPYITPWFKSRHVVCLFF